MSFANPTAPVVLHLGSHRRGGRGALRPAHRAGRALRPQHLADAAGAHRRAAGRTVASRRPCPNTRRPTTSDWSRPPPSASGSGPTRSWSAPARTRSSTSSARSSCPRARGPSCPSRPTRCTGSSPNSAARRSRAVPTPGRRRRLCPGPRRPCGPQPGTRSSSGCAAPTTRRRCPSPTAPSPTLLRRRRGRCRRRTIGRRRSWSSTRPTPSSWASRWSACAPTTRGSSSCAPPARPTPWPACGSGFAVATPAVIGLLNPYRSPASISTVSSTLVAEAMRDGSAAAANVERVTRERDRLRDGLRAAGWSVGESVTNFLLVDFATVERSAAAAEGLLRHGLVPRTFGASHPAGRPPAPDRPRPARERAPDRGRRGHHPDPARSPGDRPMTTPLGQLEVLARDPDDPPRVAHPRDPRDPHRRHPRPRRRGSRQHPRPASASTTTC